MSGPSVAMVLYGDLTFDSRVRKEARTLAEAGYDVTIACLSSTGATDDLPAGVRVKVVPPHRQAPARGALNPFLGAEGGEISSLGRRIGWLLTYARDIRSWGRRAHDACGAVDVWHAHDLTGLVAIAPSLHRDQPLVYDSHELFLDSGTAARLPAPARRLLRWYEGSLIARCTAVITVNDEIATELGRRYRPRRIDVVHNCPANWFPPPPRSSLLRDAAGIPPDTQVVLYHGALTANRGIEALIDAALDDRLAGVALVLMGFGERRDDYARLAGSERGRQRVHILDPVPPAALLPWVASADIGAMPNPGATLNDRYSSPNKLFECIAAGTPVVASDFPTMRRIVIENPDGPLGAVCEPGRVESIIDAIRSIASLDPAVRQDLRARCLRAAAERWNWDHEQEALLAVYAAIVIRPGEQPAVKPAA